MLSDKELRHIRRYGVLPGRERLNYAETADLACEIVKLRAALRKAWLDHKRGPCSKCAERECPKCNEFASVLGTEKGRKR